MCIYCKYRTEAVHIQEQAERLLEETHVGRVSDEVDLSIKEQTEGLMAGDIDAGLDVVPNVEVAIDAYLYLSSLAKAVREVYSDLTDRIVNQLLGDTRVLADKTAVNHHPSINSEDCRRGPDSELSHGNGSWPRT